MSEKDLDPFAQFSPQGRTVTRRCPNCGLTNSDSAPWCKCGYDFSAGAMWQSRNPRPERAGTSTVEPKAQATTTIPCEFTGAAREYFKIWIVNVGLTIVTLGVYSAWAKVRKKRYLYGNTRLQGSSFEYLGDPSKILKGRIIVGGGLIVYCVAAYFLPMGEGFSWLLFLLVLPWLVVRARTFIARNSSYRNIRFDFRTTWQEAFKVFLGLALFGATGIGYPYFVCRRTEFVVSHNRYGTTPFVLSWQDKIKTFYDLYFFAAPFVGLAGFFVIGFLMAGLVWVVSAILNVGGSVGFAELTPLLGVGGALVASAYLKTRITNFVWSNVTLGNHRFASSLGALQMIWLYVSNAAAILLSLGLMIPWATIRMLRYRMDHFKLLAADDLDEFVASQQDKVSAAGEEISEFFDVDVGI